MKKYLEYIILGVTALACLLYIGFRDTSEINYTLPSFRMISRDDFTKMEITGGQSSLLSIEKSDAGWMIAEGSYPADSGKVNKLLDAVEDVVPVDLVSQAGSHGRYDLDDEKKIILKAWNGDRLVREIHFGKLSSSGNYNYVLFPGDKNVYTLRGNLRGTLDASSEEYRDKTVMQLNRNDIIKITHTESGLTRFVSKGAGDAWTYGSGEEVSSEAVNALLGNLSNLKASKFLDSKPAGAAMTFTITTSTENTLTLYPKTDEGYPAESSYHNHPFMITSYTGDKLIEAFYPPEDESAAQNGITPPLSPALGPLPATGNGA
ncbi:MAG: DUF4340 domain-containing protein [Spirochaetales bacterium]|nr:DUF4340 domain-containing protein [Spirochaetales bacterium]